MIENAVVDMVAQANPDGDYDGLLERYPKAQVRNYDGDASKLTEMDAVVAYLQMLGTLVEFANYDAEANAR